MFNKWRQQRWQRKVDATMPSPEDIAAVIAHFPVLAAIKGDSAARLRRRAAEMLAGKTFLGAGGLEPEYLDCLAIALLAARPVLTLGTGAYGDFHTFILYPDEFIAEEEFEDEAGVVTRGRDLRAGEAWARGPVVLSMADVMDSAQGQGFDVVVHELAHQLDQLNGDMDGFPPLPRSLLIPASGAARFRKPSTGSTPHSTATKNRPSIPMRRSRPPSILRSPANTTSIRLNGSSVTNRRSSDC